MNTDGSDAEVYEDGSVYIPVEASLNDTDGSETLSLTVTGLPAGWSLSGAGWSANGQGGFAYNGLAAGAAYNGGFTLSPAGDTDIDLSNLTVTATATETSGATASSSDAIDVIVDAVADAPSASVANTSGTEGDSLAINVIANVTDTDGSEIISEVIIQGVPSGFTLSAGEVRANGYWHLTEAELSGLTIDAPAGYSGSLDLTAHVVSNERNLSGGEITTNNNSAITTVNFSANWGDADQFIIGTDANNQFTTGNGADIIVGDYGGASSVQGTQDYNLNIVIDTSGSMQDNFAMVQNAINSLLQDVGDYNSGVIRVNLMPFASLQYDASAGGYVNVEQASISQNATTAAGLTALTDYVNSAVAWGPSNFEFALSNADDVIDANSLSNATTYTLFISEGHANAYDSTNGTLSFTANPTEATGTTEPDVLDEINGDADGSNEIADIQNNSDEVFSILVGSLATDSSMTDYEQDLVVARQEIMNAIDSDGSFDQLTSANGQDQFADLFNDIAATNVLDNAGEDQIDGSAGDDILFGDVLFTDDLADAYNIGLVDGSGFEVFDVLEQGSSWDRDDTVSYIRNNAISLSEESNINGEVREGGNDIINGGAGNDMIFGQEGDDLINAGSGNDILSGGSGDNLLTGGAGADRFIASAYGEDQISDFSTAQGDVIDLSSYLDGYNGTQDAINNFVSVTTSNGATVIGVNENGQGSAYTTVAVLSGVTGLGDADDMLANGTLLVA